MQRLQTIGYAKGTVLRDGRYCVESEINRELSCARVIDSIERWPPSSGAGNLLSTPGLLQGEGLLLCT